jgi:hypothetical protein
MKKARIAVLAVIVIISSLFLVGFFVHLDADHERTQIVEAQQRAENAKPQTTLDQLKAMAAQQREGNSPQDSPRLDIFDAVARFEHEHPRLNRLDHLWDEVAPGIVMLGGPLIGLGLLALWVMRPGHVRIRLQGLMQVAMMGWTVFIAIRFATGDWSPALLWAEIARAIALWVAGMVPLLMVFFWTRGPQR